MNKCVSLENANVTITMQKKGKQKEAICQGVRLGLLVSTSYTTKKPAVIEKAMSLPLAPVPLSLGTADGAKRKTVKSKLYGASMSELAIVPEPLLPKVYLLQTYFLDLNAFARTKSLDSINRSIRSLAWQVMNSIPRQFTSIFLVCDTYCVNSIKDGERASRGQGKRYVLRNPDMKIPSDFDNFLRNGDNKRTLLHLIKQSLVEGGRGNMTTENIIFECGELPFH